MHRDFSHHSYHIASLSAVLLTPIIAFSFSAMLKIRKNAQIFEMRLNYGTKDNRITKRRRFSFIQYSWRICLSFVP